MQSKTWAAAAVLALSACGGGVIAIVSFVGSAGGDWNFGSVVGGSLQRQSNCGAGGNSDCVINIQRNDPFNAFATDFNVSYTGNLPGCPDPDILIPPPAPPAAPNTPTPARTDGTVRGERIQLPGCFSGRYVTINEVVSDDGTRRAFFDSEVPNLRTGVWVEIHHGQRRFKFNDDPLIQDTTAISGCELSAPAPNGVSLTVIAADIGADRLQTTIVNFVAAGQTWSGAFLGASGMRLTRGSEVMELERRDLAGAC